MVKRAKSYFPLLAQILFCLDSVCGSQAEKMGEVLGAFKTPGPCVTGLAWDGEKLWAADRRLRRIFSVDPKSGRVISSFRSPYFWPTGLAWDGKCLWCADRESQALYRLSRSGKILRKLPLRVRSPYGLAWDGSFLWLSDVKARRILKVNPGNGAILSSFPSPSSCPQGLAYDGEYLWISDRIADELYATTLQGEVIFIVPAPGPYATGLTFDGKRIINADYQNDQILFLSRSCSTGFFRSKPHPVMLTLTHETRNWGPGKVKNLEVFIAVPEQRSNQKLLSPPRFEGNFVGFLTDGWGQRFAHFRYDSIPPGKIVSARMQVKAVLYQVDYFIDPAKVKKISEIPEEIRRRYTRDGAMYEAFSRPIRKAVSEAIGSEKNAYWIARKIYRYLHRKIRYELAGGWDNAPTVLQRGTGSCSEYSFAFIAMARCAGLPARYVGSVAVRGDDASFDDVFHRWVEVFLPPYGWIPIDPSAGDSPSPRRQAQRFGHLSNRYLITTESGGPSCYMGWGYNTHSTFIAEKGTKVKTQVLGEWEPLPSQ